MPRFHDEDAGGDLSVFGNAISRHEHKLANFLRRHGISYDYHTDAWTRVPPQGGAAEQVSWARALNYITLHAPPDGVLCRQAKRTMAALEETAHRARVSVLTSLVGEMETWQPDPEALTRWIDAVCCEGHELTQTVIRHWIWLVKRKLLGMQVENHICPIFYGKSGGGKSIEALKFIEPLQSVTSEQELHQICDERHFGELARHYIIYIDEMAGAERAQLESLKSLITRSHVPYHVFYTQRREKGPQNASLIGSSNRQVVEVIRDSTSARRYWEIRCRDKLDWDALAKIDRRTIWASVDPRAPSPLKGEILHEIQDLQHHKLRMRPPQELWAEEMELEQGETAVPIDQLWAAYKKYATTNGYRAGTKEGLGRWFSNNGYPAVRRGTPQKRCRLMGAQVPAKIRDYLHKI